MENYEKIWARARGILSRNKKIVYDWINAHPHLTVHGDAKGTTCLVRYDYDIESTALAVDAMETDQVLFCHGACFEMPGYIRLGYGGFGDEQKLRDALAALGKYLEKYDK